MLHTKFRGNQPGGSGDFRRVFTIYGCRSYWSCDQDDANKVSFPLSIEVPYKKGFDWQSGFGE